MLWFSFPSSLGGFEIRLSIIFIMCCITARVFPILGAGWASNSKYAMLGGLRAVAQTISYEVRFAIIVIRVIRFISSYSLSPLLVEFHWPIILISPALAII